MISTQWRNIGFVAAIVVLLFTILHLQQETRTVTEHIPHTEPGTQQSDQQPDTDDIDQSESLKNPSFNEPAPCNMVDFGWLASDRKYWDGWGSKAMFMRPDGNFTRKDVIATEGDTICVVVLLGPTPAPSAIRSEEHLAPADSLVMTAIGRSNKRTIKLQQHRTQTNVYYAAVQFMHEDIYQLDTRIEYRSYFWETPSHHAYRPFRFQSKNKLIVRVNDDQESTALPPCNYKNPLHQDGVWMSKNEYQRRYPLDFYGMFGMAQEDHAQNDHFFIPDHCQPQYISIGQAIQCLQGQTVHVWADNNVRRNLKAFSSGNRWCMESAKSACICDDDYEDHAELYPWATDFSIPLKINETWHADTEFYFNHVDTALVEANWAQIISRRAVQLKEADIVIVGFGNDDIRLRTVTPTEFATAFSRLLDYLAHEIYPTQRIIVRTPQPFCCGSIYSTAWNSGRSEAFTQAVMEAYSWDDRVMLWNVHALGIADNMCVSSGTAYTNRKLVNIENMQLWNLLCPAL